MVYGMVILVLSQFKNVYHRKKQETSIIHTMPIYLKNISKPWQLVKGWGGHPGINRSTGRMVSRPGVISGQSGRILHAVQFKEH
jgi:hypothetical protein